MSMPSNWHVAAMSQRQIAAKTVLKQSDFGPCLVQTNAGCHRLWCSHWASPFVQLYIWTTWNPEFRAKFSAGMRRMNVHDTLPGFGTCLFQTNAVCQRLWRNHWVPPFVQLCAWSPKFPEEFSAGMGQMNSMTNLAAFWHLPFPNPKPYIPNGKFQCKASSWNLDLVVTYA